MPSTYKGQPALIITNALTLAVNIASSTNANPIQITTTSAHGLSAGDYVDITGHQTNTAANGIFPVLAVQSATQFTINATGNGVGGATGQVQPLTIGGAQIPSDLTDPMNAASVNVPLNANLDRSAFLAVTTGKYKLAQELILTLDSGAGQGATPPLPWAQTPCTNPGVYFANQGANGASAAVTFTLSNVVLGDLVEVELATSLFSQPQAGGTFVAGVVMGAALYSQAQPPGGALSAASRIVGSGQSMQTIAVGTVTNGSMLTPVNLKGTVFPSQAGNVVITPYMITSSSAGLFVGLANDYVFTARVWRQTNMPQ